MVADNMAASDAVSYYVERASTGAYIGFGDLIIGLYFVLVAWFLFRNVKGNDSMFKWGIIALLPFTIFLVIQLYIGIPLLPLYALILLWKVHPHYDNGNYYMD